MTVTTVPRHRARTVPRHRARLARETKAYLVAFFLSNVAVGGFTLATGLYLYALTGSAALFGGVVAVEFGIGLAGQVLGGSIIDRVNVLTVAVTTNGIRAGVILAGATTTVATGEPWPLIGAYVVCSVLRPVYRSASFTLVPKVCAPADLPAVNAVRFGLMQLAQLTGLLVVACLDAVLPIVSVFFVLGVLVVVSSAVLEHLRGLVPALRTADRPAGGRTSLTRTWAELGSVLRSTPSVLVHLLLSAVGAVAIAGLAVFLAPVDAGLRGGSPGIVALNGAECLGALVAIVVNRRLDHARLAHVVPLAFALLSGGLAGVALAGDIVLAAVCFLLVSFGGALAVTALDTLMQLRTDGEILGRMAICQEACTSVVALGLLPLAGAYGLRSGALTFAGAAAAVLVVVLVARTRYRGALFTRRLAAAPRRT